MQHGAKCFSSRKNNVLAAPQGLVPDGATSIPTLCSELLLGGVTCARSKTKQRLAATAQNEGRVRVETADSWLGIANGHTPGVKRAPVARFGQSTGVNENKGRASQQTSGLTAAKGVTKNKN